MARLLLTDGAGETAGVAWWCLRRETAPGVAFRPRWSVRTAAARLRRAHSLRRHRKKAAGRPWLRLRVPIPQPSRRNASAWRSWLTMTTVLPMASNSRSCRYRRFFS